MWIVVVVVDILPLCANACTGGELETDDGAAEESEGHI